MEVLVKVFLTLLSLLVYYSLNSFLTTVSPIVTNQFAGKQFDDSDSAYVVSQYGMHVMSYTGLVTTVVLCLALYLIWVSSIKKAVKNAIDQ